MQPGERLDHVRALRERGLTPKQVARTLGITPAEATRLVREAAALARTEAPEPPLIGCWISPGWSAGLQIDGHPDWPRDSDDTAGAAGLAAVLVARRHRYDKVSVCGYLTDVYCLGVKNALGPEVVDDVGLRTFRQRYFATFPGDPIEVPLELAREVVFGSAEHARRLGFDPHPDFAATAGHLGAWSGPGSITFGKDGKPFYVSGPYDDPGRVIRTLERSVGRGNFEFLSIAG